MVSADEVLAFLDSYAARFDFPALDNVQWEPVAGRLRGFRWNRDWAMVIELLLFSRPQVAYLTNAFAYGGLVGSEPFALVELTAADPLPDTPLWDQDGQWLSGPGPWRLSMGSGSTIHVGCDGPESATVRLQVADCRDEVSFIRGLARSVGMDNLTPRHAIIDEIPGLAIASEVFCLVDWDHPDVGRGEKPSDSHAIAQGARVLAGQAESISYDHSRNNVHWEC